MRPKKPERCASSAARRAATLGPPAEDCAEASAVSFRRTKYRLSVGVQVSARSSEVRRETVIVIARARKKLPVTPVVEMSGRKTTIGSTVTPIVVFLPLISTTGVTGSFFRALAITMTVSLLTSLLLALTWTPTLSLYLVRRKDTADASAQSSAGGPSVAALLAAEEAHLSGFFGRIVEFYVRTMKALLKRP